MTPRAAVAFALLAACASAHRPRPAAAVPRRAPDVHGEPLALFGPGAAAWGRVDLATLRASPHFEPALALAERSGADLATVRRELGFDVFQRASLVALAVYLPPGRGGAQGWPLVYVRGEFRRDAILDAARARNAGAAPVEATEAGVSYWTVGARAYVFPADDVVLVMERGLVRRAVARLTGAQPASVLDDAQFAPLWEEAGGTSGALVFAMDLAATRSRRRVELGVPGAGALEAFVLRGDAPGEVRLHAAGRCRDAAGATALVRAIDEVRHAAGAQLAVRLLGLSRFLNDGVRTSARDRFVRAEARASTEETSRLLRASALLSELGSGE